MRVYGLVLVVLIMMLFPSHAWSMGERPSGSGWCPKTGLYLKMGDTRLYIPPELTKNSSVRDNRAVPKNLKCYKKGDAPIETTSLWFFPSAYFTHYNPQKPLDRQGHSLLVKAYSSELEREDVFVRESFHKLNLQELPMDRGFYVYHSSSDRPWLRFYISDPKVLATPRGNPVVFSCEDNTYHGLCSTSLVIKNLGFALTQIKPRYLPVEDWPLLYKSFTSFVDSLVIQDEAEIIIP